MSAARKIDLEPAGADDAAIATALRRLEPLICDAVNMLRIAVSVQEDCFRQAKPLGDVGDQWITLKCSQEERESVEFSAIHALDLALMVKREFYRACHGQDPKVGY
jgi:hypothetical protein